MNWAQIGGVAATVATLSGGAWWLKLKFRRGGRIESPDEAAVAADQSLPGFVTGGAVVGTDGLAALAVDKRGERVALVKRRGAQIHVHEVGWKQIAATHAGIVVETGERRFGRVAVAGVDQLDMRRLAPQSLKA